MGCLGARCHADAIQELLRDVVSDGHLRRVQLPGVDWIDLGVVDKAVRVVLTDRHYEVAADPLVIAVKEVADVEPVHENGASQLLPPERRHRIGALDPYLGDPLKVADHAVRDRPPEAVQGGQVTRAVFERHEGNPEVHRPGLTRRPLRPSHAHCDDGEQRGKNIRRSAETARSARRSFADRYRGEATAVDPLNSIGEFHRTGVAIRSGFGESLSDRVLHVFGNRVPNGDEGRHRIREVM